MDWNLTRPILARGGVTHNRLAMKRWGQAAVICPSSSGCLQASGGHHIQRYVVKPMVILILWVLCWAYALLPFSIFFIPPVGQKAPHSCDTHNSQSSWSRFQNLLLQIRPCLQNQILAVSKTRTVIVGPKHSSCCCLQFACLTPMFVAQDPDPCSFKPVLILGFWRVNIPTYLLPQ